MRPAAVKGKRAGVSQAVFKRFLKRVTTKHILAVATGILAILSIFTFFSIDQTRVQSLRAYVHARPGNVYNLSSGNRLEARIVIDNAGQTYGKEVRRWADMLISEPLTLDEIEALGHGELEEGTLVVAPRTPHNFMRRLDAPGPDVAEQIKAGEKRLYVFGRIEYVDMFSNPRFSEFCFVYYGEIHDWDIGRGGPGYDSTQARYCDGHNDAD